MAGKFAAKGSLLQYESSTGPSVFSTIPAVGDFDLPLVGSRDETDITSHDSGGDEETLLGIARRPAITIPIVTWDGTNTHHGAMVTRANAGTSTNWKVTCVDTKVCTFTAYVKGVNLGAPVTGAFGASMEIKLTGAVTYT